MKSVMDANVSDKRFTMFQDCADQVQTRLLAMVEEQETALADKIKDTMPLIRRDYTTALGGIQQSEGARLERSFRDAVMAILDESDKVFQAIVERQESTDKHDEAAEIDTNTTAQDSLFVESENEHLRAKEETVSNNGED